MDANQRQRILSLRASPARHIGAWSLFVAFLLGIAGEAYGFHHDHGHAHEAAASADTIRHVHHAPEDEESIFPPALLRSDGAEDAPLGARDSDPGGTDGPFDDLPCTCIGLCHGASASPLPSIPPALTARAVDPVAAPWLVDLNDPLRTPIPYLLPFANGPPSV